MQVHTREAIKRKALIPICNCFSISTGLLTGPKSGDTLSPVSKHRAHRPFLIPVFFHSTLRCESRVAVQYSLLAGNRKPRARSFFTAAYRKQTIATLTIGSNRGMYVRRDSRTRRYLDACRGGCTISRVSHVSMYLAVFPHVSRQNRDTIPP